MAFPIRTIRIALSNDYDTSLGGYDIRDRVMYIGLTYDRYVKFARWVQADLDRRFPWHKHPLYQWARRKCGEGEK